MPTAPTILDKRPAVERDLRACDRAKGLGLAADIYGMASRRRRERFLRRPERIFAVYVVGVGSVSVGGSAKTPLAAAIAKELGARGRRVGVVLKGAGLTVWNGDFAEAPAEPYVDEGAILSRGIAWGVTVFADNKIEGTKKCADLGCHAVVIDDAYQLYSLTKDAEICVVTPEIVARPQKLLPAGPLREEVGAISRAKVVVVHLGVASQRPDSSNIRRHAEALDAVSVLRNMRTPPPFLSWYAPEGIVPIADATARLPLATVAGKRILAFSGIARPEAFEETLTEAEPSALSSVRFSDHHRFTKADLDEIASEAKKHAAELIVTTEKDYYRMLALGQAHLLDGAAPLHFLKLALAPADLAGRILDAARRR